MANLCRPRIGGKLAQAGNWFWIFVAIAVMKRYVFHRSGIELLDNYLLDFLCMPIILETLSVSMRIIFPNRMGLSIYQITVSLISVSAVFEYILPMYQTRFHADAYDVVAYCTGTLIWSVIFRQK